MNLGPFYGVMGINLLIAYVSSAFYTGLAGTASPGWVVFMARLVPGIAKYASVALDVDRCSWVMSVQWVCAILYVLVLTIMYCPFTVTMRVAVRRRFRSRPEIPAAGLKAAVFFLFVIACALGDIGVLDFPTLYNGGMISSTDPARFLVHIINSPVYMPFFSWFCAFFTVFIYYLWFYVIANRRLLLD